MSDAGASGLMLSESLVVSSHEAAEIAALVAAATAADGRAPIDDQVRMELAHGAGPGSRHVLGRAPERGPVIGYAHVQRLDDGASAHLVVHPHHRRRGHGRTLVGHLLDRLPDEYDASGEHGGRTPTLRVWAHGDTEGARGLAAACSFMRVRDLWQMHRSLGEAPPRATYPQDVHVRTFEPGRDEQAWVELNAAAFATHPEQGRLTLDDLRHRMAEPWFDPSGFFLAERDGELLGSHWTKVHEPRGLSAVHGADDVREAPGPEEDTGLGAVGEVYAVGVHPSAQGLGLGKALTLAGLEYLRGRGLAEVMLYVDGDNAAAVALYERLGFTSTHVDVMYARSV